MPRSEKEGGVTVSVTNNNNPVVPTEGNVQSFYGSVNSNKNYPAGALSYQIRRTSVIGGVTINGQPLAYNQAVSDTQPAFDTVNNRQDRLEALSIQVSNGGAFYINIKYPSTGVDPSTI